ncbi:MAG: hypothetical protein Q9195_009570 [Heterodermia aff. obscurata]
MSATSGDITQIQGPLDDNNISQFLRECVSSITKWKDFDDTDDFFSLGMDSLHALTITRAIKQRVTSPTIGLTTIYMNPSVSALAKAILGDSENQKISESALQRSRKQLLAQTLQEYEDMIDNIPRAVKPVASHEREVVILTGSTGALGSYILDQLTANPIVAHIYCLNRRDDAIMIQAERSRAHGLTTHLDPSKVTFLTANLSQKFLGLAIEDFKELERAATLVIHNAWPVNFNLSLSAFRAQFEGLVNLVDFVASAANSPHIFFILSISAVMSYRSPSTKTPETVIHEDTAPGPNGYAASKYIAERLLEHATTKLPVSASIARAGQIAGAADHAGLWSKAEWFPSLVLSSLHVGAIPESLGSALGTIDWVPIDLLGSILVDLALVEAQKLRPYSHGIDGGRSEEAHRQLSVYHPLNPRPVQWDYVRDVVVDELSSSSAMTAVETVALPRWLGKVREDIQSTDGRRVAELETSLEFNPAAKLLSFYEHVLGSNETRGNQLEIGGTLKASEKLRGVESIQAEWLRKWVREWLAQ